MKLKIGLSFLLFAISSLAQADTYTVTTSSDQGQGSLRYLIEKANLNPGADTIEIPAQYSPLSTNLGVATGAYSDHRMAITDDLIIEGLGSTQVIIDDHQRWVSSAGLINTGYPSDSRNTVIKSSGLLFQVNRNNQAGRTLNLTLKNIRVQHMSSFLDSDNANVILDNVIVHSIVPKDGSVSAIAASGGKFTIKDSILYENKGPTASSTFLFINGDLDIVNSRFASNGPSKPNIYTHMLQTLGNGVGQSSVSIKDSIFQDLTNSSFFFQRADIEISNTLINGSSAKKGEPIYVDQANLTLTNSTLYYPPFSSNTDASLKATHIELRRGAQLIANNSLLLVFNSPSNTGPTIYPNDWDDTTKYPTAGNNNSYISTPGVDDVPQTGMSDRSCYISVTDCFKPNALSIGLIDKGDSSKSVYADGSSITQDLGKEQRSQGANVDIGAYEKHITLYAHSDNYVTDEGVLLAVLPVDGVLANDTYSGQSAALEQDATHGSVTLNSDGSFQYQPDTGYYGNDEFYYSIGGSKAKVSLTVRSTGWVKIPPQSPTQQPPITLGDSYKVYADSIDTMVAPGVLINDKDDQNSQSPLYAGLTARVYKQPQHGSVVMKDDGEFTYTPNQNFTGDDVFEYEAFDSDGMHSSPTKVLIHVSAGVPHGGKVIAGTSSGGSIGFLSILLLTMFALVRNQKLLAVKIAVPLLISLSPLAHAAEENNGIYVTINPGVSWLEPDTDHDAWSQESNSQFSFGSSLGYQFDNNASIQFTYRWLNSVDLKAEHPQYNNMTVDYQHYSFNFVYRVTQLWGDQFAPYFSLGLGYLDASSNNAEDFEVEDNVHPNIGVGVNVLNFGQFKSDLQWHRLSGDVDTLELVFSYHFK